ncbi:FAD-dependent oxidoreductase [Maribellus maritimus]|uniref:FAD-dependent oxidoreductase n=1 Tax=Maribellus maritimus TaxID=2870838 RepID=UPI001EEC59CD|nr:FAD-dependent oxidoreductase [Maribellus maritimus]MCG6189537.1 FAD-dependent oxidoreductase [Maribellus maritimus]
MIDNSDNSFDVVVCGGGPSGVAAALSASRHGAKTLLIERYGFCGGMSTAALVNPWSGHEYTDPETKKEGSIIGGIFKEVATKLFELGGFGSDLSASAFDEELLKYVYDSMLIEAGVKVRFHSYIKSIEKEGEHILSVEVFSKGGSEMFYAKNFIDCTGDGDLASLANLPFKVGRNEDGLTQAMTVSFRMGNVDKKDIIATGKLRSARALVEPYFQRDLASGKLHYPYRNFIHFYDYPRPGILHFNMTRINEVSGLLPDDLTHAEIEGRRQAFLIGNWLIKNISWFKNAYVEKVATQVGVRETRHIEGYYTINQDDIVNAAKFKDGIARSRYFIDIHNPKGAKDVQQIPGKLGEVKSGFAPPEGDYYEIPFRSLLPKKCSNLVVACRALSATHESSAAIRVMATMHGIGEAAGIAAAEASIQQKDVAQISGEWVRNQIPYMSEKPDFGIPWTKN